MGNGGLMVCELSLKSLVMGCTGSYRAQLDNPYIQGVRGVGVGGVGWWVGGGGGVNPGWGQGNGVRGHVYTPDPWVRRPTPYTTRVRTLYTINCVHTILLGRAQSGWLVMGK